MALGFVEWFTDGPTILPYFDGSVPAGFPSPAEDYVETPLDLTALLIENAPATFLMRVDGDSMKDGGIFDGDLLVVDRALKPISGRVVVVAVDGEYTVKRLRRAGGAVWLNPANPAYLRAGFLAGFGLKRNRYESSDAQSRLVFFSAAVC